METSFRNPHVFVNVLLSITKITPIVSLECNSTEVKIHVRCDDENNDGILGFAVFHREAFDLFTGQQHMFLTIDVQGMLEYLQESGKIELFVEDEYMEIINKNGRCRCDQAENVVENVLDTEHNEVLVAIAAPLLRTLMSSSPTGER
ncbi:uncharacterized protein LOC132299112 isoform X2 [Cornus florida]|uniref:uncharacterized protein LOC132299112 isoform X2 n=1 Tax=Cornus florida TaxID=4283 RepID=UPI00289828E6|nr:uncharacterized protein LOC132299112 isoform X2 [Cornus florida]